MKLDLHDLAQEVVSDEDRLRDIRRWVESEEATVGVEQALAAQVQIKAMLAIAERLEKVGMELERTNRVLQGATHHGAFLVQKRG